MPRVIDKDDFVTNLINFTTANGNSNITESFSGKIVVDEKSDEGAGEIYLDISEYITDEIFFIKIDNVSAHNIGIVKKHNDGIVLKVDLKSKNIDIYFFELKKQLRYNKLQTASTQLANAYRFINYLQLDKCFKLSYMFCIACESNNLHFDSDALKHLRGYDAKLFESVYEKKSTIPLFIPLCSYNEYPFLNLSFGDTIKI